MKLTITLGIILILLVTSIFIQQNIQKATPKPEVLSEEMVMKSYWFELHRKSNKEFFYYGIPGDKTKSQLLKIFPVKVGIPNQRPTPLPKLLGKEYWLITKKMTSFDNPETAPYFLSLNIPVSDQEPFGPTPYLECSGQCNWILPGEFGLHGVNGDSSRLSQENPGSSGCIRHTDEDITYLYNLLNPETEEIRYYVEDV